MNIKQQKVRVATISETPSDTFKVSAIYKDEGASNNINSYEGRRNNVMKAIENKKERKMKSNIKDSFKKNVLSEQALYLHGGSGLDDYVDQLVHHMDAEKEGHVLRDIANDLQRWI